MDVPHDWTTGTVDSDGSSLRYYRTGDDWPVVMVHGITDNGRHWERLFSALATEYDAAIVELREFPRWVSVRTTV